MCTHRAVCRNERSLLEDEENEEKREQEKRENKTAKEKERRAKKKAAKKVPQRSLLVESWDVD